MLDWNPSEYEPVPRELLQRERPSPLGAGEPDRRQRELLKQQADVFRAPPGRHLVDREMAECCLAGLWLRHDFLDESHRLSQNVGSPTGSYWHGIMHRREGDFSNAKYWFRRVGRHAIFPSLLVEAQQLAQHHPDAPAARSVLAWTAWDALQFVDHCAAARPGTADESYCVLVADREWQLLFDYSFRQAFSG